VLAAPRLSDPPTTAPGPNGLPAATGAPSPGPHGGEQAHVPRPTGLGGLLGRGALRRHGQRGRDVRRRRRRRAWLLRRSMGVRSSLRLLACRLMLRRRRRLGVVVREVRVEGQWEWARWLELRSWGLWEFCRWVVMCGLE
jgi:hypothetical protein